VSDVGGIDGLRADRTIEDTAFVQDLAPTRFLAVLFPVWSVEVEAEVTRGEPYALIDKFVERGLAEGRLTTVPELASFLCLDEVVVSRAVRFLTAIGHLTETADQLTVTELGYRSLKAGHRFEITARDRRKLYFAGFSAAPLPSAYYEADTVTLLDDAGAQSLRQARTWPPFHWCTGQPSFPTEAVARLAGNPERRHFNLPHGVDQLRPVGEARTVWLPLHLVRAVDRRHEVRYLAYSQVGSTVNPELDAMVAASPLPNQLDVELEYGRQTDDENAVRAWLQRRGFDGITPEKADDDTWSVVLPDSAFGGESGLWLSRVGSWEVLDTCLLRLWCASTEIRWRALLERIGSYLAYRSAPDGAGVQRRLDPIARQLDLGPMGLAELKDMAAALGAPAIEAQLRRLT
jgi:hypothetical protein